MKNLLLIISVGLLLIAGTVSLKAQQATLSLSRALEMAKNGNKKLQAQALEEIYTAEQSKEIRNGYLPNISAGASYIRYFDRQVIFMPGSFVGSTNAVEDVSVGGKNALNGFVSLYQPIIDPSIHRQLGVNKISEEIEKEKTIDLQRKIAYKVAALYLSMLMMNEQTALLDQSFQRNIRALKDTRLLFLQGKAIKADTLSNFIAVENIRSAVSYLKNNIEISELELKRLIGMEKEERIELTDKLESDLATARSAFSSVDEALKIAAENRKDLNIQQLVINLQQKKAEAIRAGLMPRLSLIGQYQIQAQEDDFRLDTWPRTSFVGLQFSVPIFDGNRTKSRTRQAKIKTDQEIIRLNDLKDEVKTQLAGILSKWEEALRQMDIQQTTVESAELSHRMMEDRFKNGRSSRLELTDAELALTQSKISYLQAVYNLKVLDVELKNALGLLEL